MPWATGSGPVRGIGLVLDTLGGDTAERSLDVLRPGGHLVEAVAEEDAGLRIRRGTARGPRRDLR